MRNYEIMLLVSGDLPEVEIQKALADFKSELENVKGKITFEDVWGRRELAYPIEKQEEGFYVVYKMDIEPTVLPEFEQVLRLKKDILRYLITIPQKGLEDKKFAEAIEEGRKRRENKKIERAKQELEREKKEKEKFEIKAQRKEKKMMRKIEQEIKYEKKVEPPKTDAKKVDSKFDEKLSKIIDEDIDI